MNRKKCFFSTHASNQHIRLRLDRAHEPIFVLNEMNKKTSLQDNLKVIDLLSKHHIPLTVTSIIGFPNETEQEMRYTFKVPGDAIVNKGYAGRIIPLATRDSGKEL